MGTRNPIMPLRGTQIIEFDAGNEAKGFYELMLSRAPVQVIGKNRYVVSDIHCAILTEKGIVYKKIDE